MLIGFGVAGLYSILRRITVRVANLFILLMALTLLAFTFSNLRELRDHDFTQGQLYAKTLLGSLAKNSILICFNEPSCFSTTYVQMSEKYRTDVMIVPSSFDFKSIDSIKKQNPSLIKTTAKGGSVRENVPPLRDLLRWNLRKRPLYVSGLDLNPEHISFFGLYGDPLYLKPEGCALRVTTAFTVTRQNRDCDELTKYLAERFISPRVPLSNMIVAQQAFYHAFSGSIYQKYKCYNSAKKEFTKASELKPDYAYALLSLESLKNKKEDCKPIFSEKPDSLISKAENEKDSVQRLYLLLQASMLSPDNINLRFKLARLYANMPIYKQQAITEYNDILVLDEKNATASAELKAILKADRR